MKPILQIVATILSAILAVYSENSFLCFHSAQKQSFCLNLRGRIAYSPLRIPHCKKSAGIAVILLFLTLSACTNDNVKGAFLPPIPKTVEGASLGAVAGATVGGLIETTPSPSLLGAMAGAMLGASIGAYYDEEGILRDLERQGVTVIRLGDVIEMVIPADILFLGGEVELKRSAYPLLGQVSFYLQQYGAVGMAVEGYSDDVGALFDRLRRSELQAQSVTTYLWTHGVNLQRLHYVGMGDTITVAENRTTLGSAYNRRVTITLWRTEAASPFKTYANFEREDCWTRDDPDTC